MLVEVLSSNNGQSDSTQRPRLRRISRSGRQAVASRRTPPRLGRKHDSRRNCRLRQGPERHQGESFRPASRHLQPRPISTPAPQHETVTSAPPSTEYQTGSGPSQLLLPQATPAPSTETKGIRLVSKPRKSHKRLLRDGASTADNQAFVRVRRRKEAADGQTHPIKKRVPHASARFR